MCAYVHVHAHTHNGLLTSQKYDWQNKMESAFISKNSPVTVILSEVNASTDAFRPAFNTTLLCRVQHRELRRYQTYRRNQTHRWCQTHLWYQTHRWYQAYRGVVRGPHESVKYTELGSPTWFSNSSWLMRCPRLSRCHIWSPAASTTYIHIPSSEHQTTDTNKDWHYLGSMLLSYIYN